MPPSPTDKAQISFLLPDLESQLDPRNPLFRLARAMDWSVFEKEFRPHYCTEGRLGLPIQRLVGLLMLKSRRNLSDEEVVVFCPYAQDFCGKRQRLRETQNQKAILPTGSVEPRIGHLKSDFRLDRNFPKGQVSDAINLLLAAAASNMSFWMRQVLLRLVWALRIFQQKCQSA